MANRYCYYNQPFAKRDEIRPKEVLHLPIPAIAPLTASSILPGALV